MEKIKPGITSKNGKWVVNCKDLKKEIIYLTKDIVKDISKYEKKEIDELLNLRKCILETKLALIRKKTKEK